MTTCLEWTCLRRICSKDLEFLRIYTIISKDFRFSRKVGEDTILANCRFEEEGDNICS